MTLDVRTLLQAAVAAHQTGRLTQCEDLCRQILALDSRNTEAKLLSGVIAAKTGRAAVAISRLTELVGWDPKNFVAFNWLSMLFRDKGKLDDATSCAERAVSIRPNEPDALNNLGLCLLFQGRSAESVPVFRRAVSLRPSNAAYHHGLASAQESLGLAHDASASLEAATRLAPNPQWLVQLANLYLGEGDPGRAIDACRRAIELGAKLPLAHLLLSQALSDTGELEESETQFLIALDLEPKPSEIYKIRGLRKQSIGQFEVAQKDFMKSVEIEPRQGFAYYGIVSSRRLTETDLPLVETIENVLTEAKLDAGETSYLHFALGKAYDNLGEYPRAMGHFDEANRLVRLTRMGNRRFDRKRFSKRIDDTIRIFSRAMFEDRRHFGSNRELPILIVGMMRSGTTLLEQILSCHPFVGGAGEQSFWMYRQPSLVNFEAGEVDFEGAVQAGNEYCDLLDSIIPGMKRVTDKNPANFFALGSIHLALPYARIIHSCRNAIDTCLSIYMTPVQTPPEFGCDKADIVYAYREYLRLMAHWRSVLPPEQFVDVSYEMLIQETDTISRRMVNFCGLEWDDRCLHPENNIRSVRTPSFWQVRQPVYTTSVERWKRYESVLGAFGDLNADLAH